MDENKKEIKISTEKRLSQAENESFDTWVMNRHIELVDFYNFVSDEGFDETNIKRLVGCYPFMFSFAITEKAIFKKKLEDAKKTCSNIMDGYLAVAIDNKEINAKDAKYKQEAWVRLNTDVNQYEEKVIKYENIVTYLEDVIIMLRKIPISDIVSIYQLEKKL